MLYDLDIAGLNKSDNDSTVTEEEDSTSNHEGDDSSSSSPENDRDYVEIITDILGILFLN